MQPNSKRNVRLYHVYDQANQDTPNQKMKRLTADFLLLFPVPKTAA